MITTAAEDIRCHELVKEYPSPTGPSRVLGPISVEFARGEAVAILGPSGCGKSTLLKIVAGLLAPTSGSAEVGGRLVTGPQTQAGIVFQSAVLLDWLTVMDNITLQSVARDMSRKEAHSRATELIQMVGLDPDSAGLRPSQLSGGMQQRVAICRALLHAPDLLLLDEPFGALDALTRDQMAVDMERLWSERNVTTLMVTHSIDEAVLMSDRVLVMTPKPARVELDLRIELPRPRPRNIRTSETFTGYTQQIRDAFERCGVLH